MPELTASRLSVVACVAEPSAVDDAVAAGGGHACRVAPDEALLVVQPESLARGLEAATEAASARDPDAVVLDASDGWAACTIVGDRAREVFERVSEVPLPDEGFAQGDVAHVPAKVLVEGAAIHVLVPAMWSDHLRERLLADGSSLGLRERDAAGGGS